jgi:Spy/CpxP family protein refolding chaperone
MKRTLTLFLGAILLVGASAFAAGAGHWHGAASAAQMAQMTQRHDAMLTKALDLTVDQQAALQKLRQEQAAKAQPLMAQRHQQMQEIHALLAGDNPDPAEIGQRMIDSRATGRQLKALHDDFTTKFSALLNPDQLAKFQQLQAARPGRGERTPVAQ